MKLVSAIMPTRGRKEWAAQALKCFLAQTYANKELIVLDDATEPSFDSGIAEPTVKHYVSDSRRIDEKRNIACHFAQGEIILHWDSDDYSSPERIEHQVNQMEASGKAVVGYHTMPFFEEESKKAFLYVGHPLAAVGTSLCYTREFWNTHKFLTKRGSGGSVLECEDNGFVFAAKAAKQIATVPCGPLMVARIHPENTTPKHSHYYKPFAVEELAKGFFD